VSWSPAPAAVTPTASSVTFAHSYNAVNQRTGQTATDTGANVWIEYPKGPATSTAYTASALNQPPLPPPSTRPMTRYIISDGIPPSAIVVAARSALNCEPTRGEKGPLP